MKILVTGNLGYIGSVLTEVLSQKGFEVTGFDSGYFEDCSLIKVKKLKKQIYRDIRKIDYKDIEGHDSIIHLAALSNDPLGEFNAKFTEEINFLASVRIATIAKKLGVKRFINISTQSIYGISKVDAELDEYTSKKNPVTEYAKSKWKAEQEIAKLKSNNFDIVTFRPATVFGASPRLRCDIVFNNFVGSAYTTGKIEIKSDGTPWRPVIHVKDLCSVLSSSLLIEKKIISGKAYNVGVLNGNYTVKELAESASKNIKNSKIFYSHEHNQDSRTYKVSFQNLYKDFDKYFKPEWNLDSGAKELISFFKKINFSKFFFEGSKTNRLICLKDKITKNQIIL